MDLAHTYWKGLKAAYYERGQREQWDSLEAVVHGVSSEDLAQLRAVYPALPDSLVELLTLVDGTYWRRYAEEELLLYFLGSDLEEYPYYLLSAQQMLETRDDVRRWGDYLITREFDDIPVDAGVCDDLDRLCWLHFADCRNNGGTSQLFLDFSPSPAGTPGQVLRFLHDPDELVVIADCFEDYLRQLMARNYDFIHRGD